MRPSTSSAAVIVTIVSLFLAGCTAPTGDGDDQDQETPTDGTGDADALPPIPSGTLFRIDDAESPLRDGDRAAVGLVDDGDRFDLWLGGDTGGGLYYGQEDGSWAAADDTEGATVDSQVCAATIGDLDDDLRNEIVLVGEVGLVVLWNGNHSYTQETLDLGGLETPVRLALADLDNDGRLDILVGSTDGGLHALFNAGDRTFDAPVPLLDDTTDAGAGFVLMDVDDDLLLDLVVAPAEGGLALWLNQPGDNGTFAARGDKDGLPGDARVTGLFPVDLDNDRRIDLLATTEDAVLYLENTGRVAFRDKSDDKGLPTDGAYRAPLALDIDIDGWQDVFFLDDTGTLRMYWNAEGQGLRERTPEVDTLGLSGFAGGDFDRDGRIELLGLQSDASPVALDNVWEDGVWFGVHLVGDNTTTTGIGSKVELTVGSSFPMFRQVGGLAAPDVALPLDPHFGFGSVTGQGFSTDMALVILWPSGTFQGRDIPRDEGFDARVTARENTEELTWDEGGTC